MGVAEGTFYRWESVYGAMEVFEATLLKDLESENAKLKCLLADAMPDNTALKEVVSKKWKSLQSADRSLRI